MQIVSLKKRLSALGALNVLVGVVGIVLGLRGIGSGDQVTSWAEIILGIFLFVGGIKRILGQVVQIVVDDREIRYRRRGRPDLVIEHADVIDSEVLPNRIRFCYKAACDIHSTSLPLRLFRMSEAERLRQIFAERTQAQQDVTPNA